MKSSITAISTVVALSLIALLGSGFPSARADQASSQQAQTDDLKKTYTLTTCPVSGDKLDSAEMGGKPVDYVYTQKNADGTETKRLVRFCCKDCLVKFKRNPDKYLKVLDAAQAKKTSDTMPPDMNMK